MRRRPLLLALPLLLSAVVASGAAALPQVPLTVKCAPDDVTADGRVFPEPRVSVAHLSFPDFSCGIRLLEQQHPDRVEVTTTGTSKGGLPVYDVLVTDETVTTPKEKLLVVSSIHGDEVPGREGGGRVVEDLLTGAAPEDLDVDALLSRYVVHFLFPNPDGWAGGDVPSGGLAWSRGNDSGRDLNRNFPVQGWIDRANGTLQEPESRGVRDLLQRDDGRDWYLGTDNHGQLDDTYAAAGLQIVGEFDYQKSETLARFADGINASMARYPVLAQMQTAGETTGQDAGPYHWGTLYDMLGYSASGSLIDYFNTPGLTNGYGFATELTLGKHLAGNSGVFSPLLAQVWVDSIRAIDYEMFRQALDRRTFTFPVGSRTAYVHDPSVVTDSDEDGAGYTGPELDGVEQVPYTATRMRFFEDLSREASRPLTPLSAEAVTAATDLRDRFDTLVLADRVAPEQDRAAFVDRLRAFAEQGGTLVLTDASAQLLPDLGLVGPGDVAVDPRYVGYVDFGDRSLPLNAGLRGVARQTYDTVPIGYSFGQDTAPNWTVTSTAWEAGGGVTAGTNGTGRTVYGEKPLGQGRVRFLGALLPQPTEAYYHPFGLQDHAVTYTGYTLLENMLKP